MSNTNLRQIVKQSLLPLMAVMLVLLLIYFQRLTVSPNSAYQRTDKKVDIAFQESNYWNLKANRILTYVVTDFDGDQFADLCYLFGDVKLYFECSPNKNGKNREELFKTEIGEFKNLNGILSSDLNLDSINDYIIYSDTKLVYLESNKNNQFKLKSMSIEEIVRIKVVDYNQDQFPDLIGLDKNEKIKIWLNKGDGTFSETEMSDFEYQWMYSDNSSIKFNEISNPLAYPIGRPHFSFDINQDAIEDHFVGGFYFPPVSGIKNKLWISSLARDRYEESSSELAIEKCGVVLNVISSDFNLDSYPELILTTKIYSPEDKAFHYQLPCFFVMKENQFADYSSMIFDENIKKSEIKMISTVDADNDGLADLVWVDHEGTLKSLKNTSQTSSNWLGLVFKSKFGSKIPNLVKAEIYNWRNDRISSFSFSPDYGNIQGDYRKIISLGKETHATIKIFYSKNLIKTYNLKANEYHEIVAD